MQLQLRAEEIHAQSQQLALLRQRLVQLAVNGRMQVRADIIGHARNNM